jgi:hypothetical protein
MKADELELFDHLSRNSKFRDWLDSKLEEDMKVLVQSNDMVQIHKAQGRAGLLNQMLRLLNEAPAAVKR